VSSARNASNAPRASRRASLGRSTGSASSPRRTATGARDPRRGARARALSRSFRAHLLHLDARALLRQRRGAAARDRDPRASAWPSPARGRRPDRALGADGTDRARTGVPARVPARMGALAAALARERPDRRRGRRADAAFALPAHVGVGLARVAARVWHRGRASRATAGAQSSCSTNVRRRSRWVSCAVLATRCAARP
jgi:hypothetical protein